MAGQNAQESILLATKIRSTLHTTIFTLLAAFVVVSRIALNPSFSIGEESGSTGFHFTFTYSDGVAAKHFYNASMYGHPFHFPPIK